MNRYFFSSKPGIKAMQTAIYADTILVAFLKSYYICKKEKVRLTNVFESVTIDDILL